MFSQHVNHNDLNWEFYIIRVGIFFKQKYHYSIYFSLMEIKLRQWAEDLIFTNLITWKRNESFKWQLETETGFIYFPSPILILKMIVESDHFFLNYIFISVILGSVVLLLPLNLTASSENHNQMINKKQWGSILILHIFSIPQVKSLKTCLKE